MTSMRALRWVAVLILVAGCASTVTAVDGGGEDEEGDAVVADGVGRPSEAGVPADQQSPTDLGSGVDCAVPDGGRSLAGARCEHDADCDPCGTTRLTCLHSFTSGGFCTAPCDSGGRTATARTCGGVGATCLVRSALGPLGVTQGACARACGPRAPSEDLGGCGDGEVCTAYWRDQTATAFDAMGCSPFCADDRQCEGVVAAPRCNVRLGRCAAEGVDLALRRDGDPCDPVEIQSTGRPRCRGMCFAVASRAPERGLCGSYINLARTAACPDDPMQVILGRGIDSLGLCLQQACERNRDCPSGLICRRPESDEDRPQVLPAPYQCNYPTVIQPIGAP